VELVRLSLLDLPAPLRSAVNLLQLRCVDASAALSCLLDDLLAVRDEMVADVDAALLGRLHNRVAVDGTQVPALFFLPEAAAAPAKPSIRLTHYGIHFADERTPAGEARGDYTVQGNPAAAGRLRLRPLLRDRRAGGHAGAPDAHPGVRAA